MKSENLFQYLKAGIRKPVFSWGAAGDYAILFAGGLVEALAMRMFLIPARMVSGGVSGAAQIINDLSGWPIGLMVFLGNLPLFILGWRFLGGARFAFRTIFAISVFSLATDLLVFFVPQGGVTDDLVLNALYGGVLLGVGLGLIHRGKGTSGGTDILARVLNFRFGISISQGYLITDAIVVLASGLAFGWELALYALVVIYVSGLAAEMVSEGSSIFRTVIVITSQPDAVAERIMSGLERGVTVLSGTGAYTGSDRPVLYCVVTRSEVNQLKALVVELDRDAFMVIGIAHEAIGEGFRPLKM